MNKDAQTKEDILEGLGLSKNDAKVYLALLDLGASTITAISDRSKINRVNIYDCLNRLIDSGLVSYHQEKDKKLYEPADPQLLMGLVKEKELLLNSIMPELKLKNQLSPKKSEAHIYEGIVAVRNMMNHFLELNQPRYSYGAPMNVSKLLGEYFLQSFHRKRVKQKMPFYFIYNSDAKERIRYLNSMDYTEARYLPKEYDSPVTTNICGDEVVIFLYSENPLIIQIKNAKIAAAYKNYFDLLWGMARKDN